MTLRGGRGARGRRAILALDVGNTHTVVGAFIKGRMARHWRVATDPRRTADEMHLILKGLLGEIGVDLDALDGIALSSVVPAATRSMAALEKRVPVFAVSCRSPLSFKIDVPLPSTVGADRLVNAEAAIARYGAPLILVDAGTATTLCCVTADRRYRGGAIAPGLSICAEALFARASQLASVDLCVPDQAIGNSTETNVRSGLVLGHACMVDGMVARFVKEMGPPRPKVIGTGGTMDLLASACRSIDVHDPTLTLDGLFILFRRWQAHRRGASGRDAAPTLGAASSVTARRTLVRAPSVRSRAARARAAPARAARVPIARKAAP